MRARSKALETVFAEVPRHRVFEGSRTTIARPDGSEDDTPFVEASSEFSISFDELPTLQLEDLLKKLDRIVEDLARQKAEHFFKTIREAAEKVGNTVDGKGQGLSPELYLKVLDTIWVEFESGGKPRLPTLVVGPQQRDTANSMLAELVSNPTLRKRFEGTIEKKREIWRAREADRELVG